jgi:glycosyltransferase involved in cell wall biosynthesis
MPCYNVEKYVAEAVESMLNQTFEDFELIMLDDCSTDKTAEIIKQFDDERIVYYKNEQNLGLVGTLNIGLQLAAGELIARMDGDDISLPSRLERQIRFLDENPDIVLCSGGMELFGTENNVWIRESNPEDVKITMLFYSPVLHASSVFRKQFFLDNHLIYRKEAFPAEDYDLWSRAVFFGKFANIPEVLYKYRIHGVQVTRTVETRDRITRQVQTCFIKSALPSANDEDIEFFVNRIVPGKLTEKEEMFQLKTTMLHFVEANKKDNFFDQNRLEFRLKRYYQSRVFEYVKRNKAFEFRLLKELRLKQFVKLIL